LAGDKSITNFGTSLGLTGYKLNYKMTDLAQRETEQLDWSQIQSKIFNFDRFGVLLNPSAKLMFLRGCQFQHWAERFCRQ